MGVCGRLEQVREGGMGSVEQPSAFSRSLELRAVASTRLPGWQRTGGTRRLGRDQCPHKKNGACAGSGPMPPPLWLYASIRSMLIGTLLLPDQYRSARAPASMVYSAWQLAFCSAERRETW